MKFEWKYCTGFTTFGLLKHIQEFMNEQQCDPKAGSSSCQCSTTLCVEKKTQRNVKAILTKFRIMLADFFAVMGHSWDLDQKRNGTELIMIILVEFGTNLPIEFSETAHPIFRASSAFERGELRSKGGGKKSFHFNGSEQNVELILRTDTAANQLSIYGAVADMCREVSKDTMASGKSEVHDPLGTMEIPSEHATADPRTNEQLRETCCKTLSAKFEQLSDDQKLSQTVLQRWIETAERGQYLITLGAGGPSEMVHI